MTESSIEWTDATWNPVAGCAIISPGCSNCYAMRMAARLDAMGIPKYSGLTRKSGGRAIWTGNLNLDEKSLELPLSWKKPRMVFVNSMSDLFQDGVSEEFIVRVWSIMAQARQHTFQILTKRPDRMAKLSKSLPTLPNVWLGVSIENAENIWRLNWLKETEAAIRFISFEPLIGPVGQLDLSCVDWAIIGGESGPRSRPMEQSWVMEIKKLCRKSGTAFFFKQWGGVQKSRTGRILNGRTWDEFPQVAVA